MFPRSSETQQQTSNFKNNHISYIFMLSKSIGNELKIIWNPKNIFQTWTSKFTWSQNQTVKLMNLYICSSFEHSSARSKISDFNGSVDDRPQEVLNRFIKVPEYFFVTSLRLNQIEKKSTPWSDNSRKINTRMSTTRRIEALMMS
jgi:hypothetical protein